MLVGPHATKAQREAFSQPRCAPTPTITSPSRRSRSPPCLATSRKGWRRAMSICSPFVLSGVGQGPDRARRFDPRRAQERLASRQFEHRAGGTKDTWVIDDACRRPSMVQRQSQSQSAVAVKGEPIMLARTADNLFWLSRYIERAESLARILDVALRLATLPSAYAGTSNEWESAIDIADLPTRRFLEASMMSPMQANVTQFIIAGPKAIRSRSAACIETARAQCPRGAHRDDQQRCGKSSTMPGTTMQRLKFASSCHLQGSHAKFLAFVKESIPALRWRGLSHHAPHGSLLVPAARHVSRNGRITPPDCST